MGGAPVLLGLIALLLAGCVVPTRYAKEGVSDWQRSWDYERCGGSSQFPIDPDGCMLKKGYRIVPPSP
jgi:hypothetical protein